MAKKPETCQLHEENIQLQLQAIHASVKSIMDLNELSVKHHNEKLEAILEQTTKTNGRVTRAEAKHEELIEQVALWTWLTTKPYRLVVAIMLLVSVSKLITNEMLWNLIIKLFS